MSKIVVVAAAKGGVGKTTIAYELAAELSGVLVDLDWDSGGASRMWGYDGSRARRVPLLDGLERGPAGRPPVPRNRRHQPALIPGHRDLAASTIPADLTADCLTAWAPSGLTPSQSWTRIRERTRSRNSFCTFLVTDGVLAGNPMSGVTRPHTAKRTPKPLRGDDIPERLLTALADGARQARDPWPERDLAVIVTLLVTGIRSSELLGRGSALVVHPR
jgi:hypothetical protein